MPTLYLLRHGNACFGSPEQTDHDRVLNQAGERAALLVGQYLAQLLVRLDLVLCSSAQRTRQTWELVASCLRHPPDARFERALYLCGARAMRQRIRALPNEAETAMIVSHNPDLHEAALFYSGIGDRDAMAKLQLDYSPAGLVALRFERPWAELRHHMGCLQCYVVPGDLD
ncbi:MAG: histidine phosphatase family protein [Proteobacteria bacterium]|nr:histidine phosphatase family protein [Pseudomonadota bacterium]